MAEETKNLHVYFGLRRFFLLKFSSGQGNAPGTLQDGMEVIVSSGKWQSALASLNSTIILSWSVEQHINDIRIVFSLQIRVVVRVNLKTCVISLSTKSTISDIFCDVASWRIIHIRKKPLMADKTNVVFLRWAHSLAYGALSNRVLPTLRVTVWHWTKSWAKWKPRGRTEHTCFEIKALKYLKPKIVSAHCWHYWPNTST